MRRPTLEVLFARAAQGRSFLWMTVGGLLLGALLTLAGRLQRRHAWLGRALDALTALLAAGMALAAAFLAGEGLRLYALLGLLLGGALWRAGVQPLIDAAVGAMQKLFRNRQE